MRGERSFPDSFQVVEYPLVGHTGLDSKVGRGGDETDALSKTNVVTGDVFGPHQVNKKRPNAVHAKWHGRADGRPHRGGFCGRNYGSSG